MTSPPLASKDIQVHAYHLPPTRQIPNSPHPLLHYPGLLLAPSQSSEHATTIKNDPTSICFRAHNLFIQNNWETQWIFRYGPTQASHYHSCVHECMVVLSGTARIRFGLEDGAEDEGEYSPQHQQHDIASSLPQPTTPGLTLPAHPGDIFILPAGVAHKTQSLTEGSTFALLTPGDGHGIDPADVPGAESVEDVLRQITDRLDGFAMLGAYPRDSGRLWDFATGGEDVGDFGKVWRTEVPGRDPVLGEKAEGIVGCWKK